MPESILDSVLWSGLAASVVGGAVVWFLSDRFQVRREKVAATMRLLTEWESPSMYGIRTTAWECFSTIRRSISPQTRFMTIRGPRIGPVANCACPKPKGFGRTAAGVRKVA